MSDKPDIDPHSGVETTGHEWDGVKELNKPLPKWWLWTFYATIVWAIVYWLLMPSWPLVSSYTEGLLGYSQRERVTEQVAAAVETAAQLGSLSVVVNCAGIGNAIRVVAKDGTPFPLDGFTKVIQVNLIGTFNVIRLAAAKMIATTPTTPNATPPSPTPAGRCCAG